MTTEQWQRAEELFDAARSLTAAEREPFITAECDGDDDLAREVLSLLAHAGDAEDAFLAAPPPDARLAEIFDAAPPDDLVGRKIGRYTIKRLIAAGGMGAVYLAEQDRPKREVALKILHAAAASRSLERRFEFESQVLARLQHPNIAQIFEAGAADIERLGRDGVPRLVRVSFFAMEYVPGARTITRFANDESLSPRERLAVFVQACDAVTHGHQRGVIHRDLKPANILVSDEATQPQSDEGGRKTTGDAATKDHGNSRPSLRGSVPSSLRGFVKIIDFGVARSTDADVAATTMRTDAGQLVGTLAYMSPEQCDADPLGLDVRTDVYSLGIVLYELLCGRPPYDVSRTSIYAAVKTIKETSPDRPGTVDRKLRGDLEAIVLKAIEKDKQKRYASVADLAADIRRYVAGEPIAARKPSAFTRATRWAARHPLRASLSLLAVITAVWLGLTSLTVHVLYRRPYKFEIDRGEHLVRLMSRAGATLQEWSPGPESEIQFAQLLEQSKSPDGGRIALLGVGGRATGSLQAGLTAFDVDRSPSKPLWHSFVRDEDIPAITRKNRGFVGHEYGLSRAILADVFTDRPCPQIVAAFQNDYTHTSLRVIDLGGQILSEVWVDVMVHSMYWMSDPGLLVLAGLNGEVVFEDRGYPSTGQTHPQVIFALRPRLGFRPRVEQIADSYVVQEGVPARGTDEALVPCWYRCLLPPTPADIGLSVPRAAWPAANHVQISATFAAPYPVSKASGYQVSVLWVFDEKGTAVDGPAPGDAYDQNQALPDGDPRKLPSADSWSWGPLPERLPYVPSGPSVWKPGSIRRPTTSASRERED